jgi:hypothetical protein
VKNNLAFITSLTEAEHWKQAPKSVRLSTPATTSNSATAAMPPAEVPPVTPTQETLQDDETTAASTQSHLTLSKSLFSSATTTASAFEARFAKLEESMKRKTTILQSQNIAFTKRFDSLEEKNCQVNDGKR